MLFVPMLGPINFLVWNIQGASKIDSLQYLKKMKFDFNVKILVLLEPMADEGRLDFVKQFIGCQSAASFVNGKIWVLWDLALTISFSTFADQLVDMEFSSPAGALFLSVVHDQCTRVARRPLWSAMEGLASSHQGPWMLARDFNIIAEASKWLGGLHLLSGTWMSLTWLYLIVGYCQWILKDCHTLQRMV